MYIFIDESGIHKLVDNSVIAIVYVMVKEIITIEYEIRKIEKELGIEFFHWSSFGSKRGWNIRSEFISRVSGLDFFLKIAVIKNPISYEKDLEGVAAILIN